MRRWLQQKDEKISEDFFADNFDAAKCG